MYGLQQVHLIIRMSTRLCAKHLLVENHHSGQPSNLLRDYTWAACRSISDRIPCASGFTYYDAIMLPLLGSEKPSAVRIIIGHTYYTLSSGTTHS